MAQHKSLNHVLGGGACWDQNTYNSGYCATTPKLQDPKGVFTDVDMSKKTLVVALYCSGDLFIGNKTMDFIDTTGQPVQQRGTANMQAVLDWTKKQLKDSSFSPRYLNNTLAKLTLMGVSAGAIAIPIWSDLVFRALPAEEYGIVGDSYVLFMPTAIEGPLLRDTASFCTSYLLPASLLSKCTAGTLRIADLYLHNMRLYPQVAFANIQAKEDSTQTFYYNAVRVQNGLPTITTAQYYNLSLAVIEELNLEPNFLIFLINSNSHGYTYTNRYGTADEYSDSGATAVPGRGTALRQWVAAVPLQSGVTLFNKCQGDDCLSSVTSKSFTAPNRVASSCLTIKTWKESSF
jgi:hypothetical protein